MSIGKGKKFYGLAGVAVALLVPAWMYRNHAERTSVEATANFRLEYVKPAGWIEEPAGLQTLFVFRNPKTRIAIRGSQSQVVSEANPTPELDRDGLTNQFANVTRDNLGWKATILDTVICKGSTYRLIRRETVDRTIVTAIAVKGNTTILVTMAGVGKAKDHIDLNMPMFKKFLEGTQLEKRLYYD